MKPISVGDHIGFTLKYVTKLLRFDNGLSCCLDMSYFTVVSQVVAGYNVVLNHVVVNTNIDKHRHFLSR